VPQKHYSYRALIGLKIVKTVRFFLTECSCGYMRVCVLCISSLFVIDPKAIFDMSTGGLPFLKDER